MKIIMFVEDSDVQFKALAFRILKVNHDRKTNNV